MIKEKKITNEAKSAEFKRLLKEGLQNGTFMTADEFCRKLDTLKASLREKYNARHRYNNS